MTETNKIINDLYKALCDVCGKDIDIEQIDSGFDSGYSGTCCGRLYHIKATEWVMTGESCKHDYDDFTGDKAEDGMICSLCYEEVCICHDDDGNVVHLLSIHRFDFFD